MSSNSSGKKLEGFFTGKGFYIVLFLCAAVSAGIITVSTRLFSMLTLLLTGTSFFIATSPAAIIHADTPITAAHRKRTM